MVTTLVTPRSRPGTLRSLALTLLAGLPLFLTACETPNPLLRRLVYDDMVENRWDQADERTRQALRQDPTDWKSHYYMGLIRLHQERPLDAQVELEQALALRPAHFETTDILDAIAEALYQQKLYPELTRFLRQAIDDRHMLEDYLRQAKYLRKMGDIDGSDLALRKVARFSPSNDAKVYLRLADFYDEIGDQERAIKALRNAYYIAPTEPIAARLKAHGYVPGPTAALPPER